MKFSTVAWGLLGLTALVSAEVYFEEKFNDGEAWTQRWTPSSYRDDLGKFSLTAGKWYGDEKEGVGLQTSEDYRFYAISAPFAKSFDNTGKTMVIQFTAKNEQKIDCGGGYLKFFPPGFDKATFNGDSEYNIMFGPDICGSKSVIHVIFNYKGTNYNLKKSVPAPSDQLTHVYTLIVTPDQKYQVFMDEDEKASGSLIEDWDFLPPKKIPDPKASKPADWVDLEEIPDPEDKKPEGYDDVPEYIPDPEAKKPEDWDDDMDGDWEAPSITNPKYSGPWSPRMIKNPDYKGPWVHPEIDNPEYKVDDTIYAYNTAHVGIDIWQVKAGTIFDNILVTDDVEYAEAFRKTTWKDLKEKETDSKNAIDALEQKKSEENQKILGGHGHSDDHSDEKGHEDDVEGDNENENENDEGEGIDEDGDEDYEHETELKVPQELIDEARREAEAKAKLKDEL